MTELGLTVVQTLPAANVDDTEPEDDDVEVDDDARGFVAARTLGPAKARMLLMVLIASGITDPAAVQAAFDAR